MRAILGLALLAGCLPPEEVEKPLTLIDVDWRGALSARTNGFALRDDGQGGQAGMNNTTCTFSATGGLAGDDDPSSDEETVLDGGNDTGHDASGSGGGYLTLATTHDHLYLFADSGEPDRGSHVESLHSAVLAGAGVAYTEDSDGCNVHFAGRNYADHEFVPVDSWVCTDGSIAASHDDDAVVVVGPDDVVVVTPSQTTPVGGRGSLVAWDDFAGVIYVAQRGEGWVQALEPSGGLRWEVDLGDPVHSLDDLGAQEAVAVMVATAEGGAMRILDGQTGEMLVDEPTPSTGTLVGARGGDTLGVATEGEVHLFDLLPNEAGSALPTGN